jgi:hypothetical protein
MNTVDLVEDWRDVVGYEDRYEISNFGNLRSKSYLKKGRNVNGEFSFITQPRLMKPTVNGNGYLSVYLSRDGESANFVIHRLVAITFLENPDNLPVVNHKDCDKTNNRVDNLEWCTQQHNVKHSYESGTKTNLGDKHPRRVLNSEIVCKMRKMFSEGIGVQKIADHFGFRYDTTKSAITGKNWGHVVCDV